MREPGGDGNLNVMFFKNFQIICLRKSIRTPVNSLVFLIYCQEHRSSFFMEVIRNMTDRFPHKPDLKTARPAQTRPNGKMNVQNGGMAGLYALPLNTDYTEHVEECYIIFIT